MDKHEYWALIESHISISLVFFFFCNFFGSIIEQSHMESVSAKLHSKWIIESNQCSCLTSKPTMMFYFQRCLIRFAGKFPGFGHSASCVYIMSVNNKGSSSYYVKSSTEAKHGKCKVYRFHVGIIKSINYIYYEYKFTKDRERELII